MARRVVVLAHGRAGAAADPVFGDPGRLVAGTEISPVPGRVLEWLIGPEPACRETAELAGAADPSTAQGLAGPDLGRWTGRRLSAVAAEDPAGLQAWLSDPTAAPHGGESLADAQVRVGDVVDGRAWPDGRSVVVVSPVVARLLALHAIGGAADLGFRLDVRFGGLFELSRAGRGWRLLLG